MPDSDPASRFARVKKILLDLADMDTNPRASYLDEVCADDPDLREEVEHLLAHEDTRSEFMANQPSDDDTMDSAPTSQLPETLPTSIASYRILGVLGQGGMGTVYEAEQSSPRRNVALKVVRGGRFVDDTSVKLFQREAESLGRLKHPGIGAIYESGRTEEGQHYFAMELVRGKPLDEYVAHTTRESLTKEMVFRQLTLFRSICDAVHYAHQRGVIHRDLKPSNIVVNNEGQPKILDFGLARITDADGAGSSLTTEVGAIRGTLSYMSPEQARGNPGEIDARTDVYSLGVILYELLAGIRPYDLGREQIVDALRIICEEAPRPLSKARRGGPKIDSDLETIVGKALAKDVDQRYVTASALGNDVDRYLSSRPILARAPSVAYRIRKFVRRNQILVGSALATTIALVAGGLVATMLVLAAGVIVTSILAIRASKAQRVAVREAQTAARVSEFLAGLFKSTTPGNMRESELTAKEVIDVGAKRLMTELTEDPVVRSELLTIIGSVYTSLGEFDAAEPLLQEAVTVLDQSTDDESVKLADSLDALAANFGDRGRTAESDSLARRAVALADADGDPALRAKIRITLANNRNADGDFRGAEAMYREVIALYEAMPDAPTRTLSTCYINIANNRLLVGDFDVAESYYRRALALDERDLGTDHYQVATTIHNLALIYTEEGHLDEALELEKRSLAIRENVLGSDHWHVALTLANLGRIAMLQGELVRAEELLRRAVTIDEAQFEAEKIETADDLDFLAIILIEQGRLDDAEVYANRAATMYDALGLPKSNTPGWLQLARGEIDEAETVFRAALSEMGDDDWFPSIFEAHAGLAEVACERGDSVVMNAEIEKALGAVDGRWIEDHPRRRKLLELRGRL